MIIDSNLSRAEAIKQNPEQPAPENIIRQLAVVAVDYYGFDNETHRGQIVVHQDVSKEVKTFFERALKLKFPIQRVVPPSAPEYGYDGPKVIDENVSVGFNYRPILGTDKLSQHSYGLAFDINPWQNPYICYVEGSNPNVIPEGASYIPDEPGTLTADHELVKIMEDFGWEWGGLWSPESGRTDYQHFQKPLE